MQSAISGRRLLASQPAAAAPGRIPARRALQARTQRRAATVLVEALKVGDRLQDYPDYYRVLKASDGSSVALSKFEGKKAVVCYFFPKAGTPGCTKQSCSFRDAYERFVDAGAVVFGISGDSPEENKKFAEANRITFPLLTDQGNFLRKSFGVKPDLFGFLPGRQTFVIDKKGVVQLSFNDQLGAENHVKEALPVVQRLV